MSVLFFISTPLKWASADDSCDCPKVSCNLSCEYEDSVSFYSEKCGDGSRVRSCARPKCVALPNAPAQCLSAAPKTENDAAKTTSAEAAGAARDVASVPEAQAPRVGIVKEIEGQVWVTNEKAKELLKLGSLVNQSDKIETAEKSKVMVQFNDGNTVVITEKSVVVLSSFNFSDDMTKRNTLLNLIKGKVRNQVKQKYTGRDQSFFKVKTPVAVAGVRGTDFTVSFEVDKADLVSKIETVHGEVEFQSAVDHQSTIVSKEQKSKMIVRNAARLVSDDGQLAQADWTGRAHLEPATTLPKSAILWIEKETEFESQVALSNESNSDLATSAACQNPIATVNQCSWKCENNPKGEAVCRSDLPGVSCVRRMCNANGLWTDSFRLPASFSIACDPKEVVVGPCDY